MENVALGTKVLNIIPAGVSIEISRENQASNSLELTATAFFICFINFGIKYSEFFGTSILGMG